MRPSMARNNMLSKKAKKKKFWKNKISEPVLLSQTNPAQVAVAIQNRLFHNGYFRSVVTYDTLLINDRKAKFHTPSRCMSLTGLSASCFRKVQMTFLKE
jgi:outer membrane protein insertion porin family